MPSGLPPPRAPRTSTATPDALPAARPTPVGQLLPRSRSARGNFRPHAAEHTRNRRRRDARPGRVQHPGALRCRS
jgi:hypothetical protein